MIRSLHNRIVPHVQAFLQRGGEGGGRAGTGSSLRKGRPGVGEKAGSGGGVKKILVGVGLAAGCSWLCTSTCPYTGQ